MDDRLRVFAVVLGSGGFCAVLGGLFGALTGATYWGSSKAAGTVVGLTVARALAGGRELSRKAHGAIVGAIDGIVFLGVVGSLAGAFLAHGRHDEGEFLGPAAAGLAFLVALAALFGTLAYAAVRAGVYAVVGIFAGGLTGGLLGAWAAAWVGTYRAGLFGWLIGAVAGVLAGTALGVLARRYSPRFTAPRAGPLPSRQRRHGSTDVTDQGPHSSTGYTLPDEP
ncbi:MAG TPA: hypothetical protein VFE78_29830 [Gemmataceae bacterium]|jgi:hypothetical protein|nr:hypothetical protein [Gemmataceae bacterium]